MPSIPADFNAMNYLASNPDLIRLKHPLILSDCKNGCRHAFLLDHFSEAFDEWLKAGFRHVGDEFVEHATLTKQGMGAPLGGVDLEMAVHAEALARGPEQGQQEDREGVEQEKPIAPLRVGDMDGAEPHPEPQVLGIAEAGFDGLRWTRIFGQVAKRESRSYKLPRIRSMT